VVVSALSTAVIAAAASWYFQAEVGQNPFEQVWRDAAWAGGVALVASLVALAAMPFFESMFDITTTLRLLELTDRNHEALQMIQTKAFGTFNHSLMVGTLADKAAKAIGANSILARAAAYYHDLGKTENPMFFIENQFGSANPHDELPPEESARIIRQHVVDGVELARKYNIPSEVSEGIVSHHGDGIMRYFYEKARQETPEVDPDLFRHAGHKPQTREMAILMMSDAVEAACRAVFQDEEPKPESIAKVVNRVIDEKVADGQLSESDLTLHELTTIRRAFIEALTGHYHQRISYPHFPGS
jgi:putative nucleotidyltransferase with HDIG domain